jgi:protein-S-isoprenylcysteine O-methyltransferase Ste14
VWLFEIVGSVFVLVGVVALIGTFTLYVIDGDGTPAPVAPTDQLVVRGLNRYVRNPMYVAVVAVIIGESVLLARPVLLLYAAAAFALMAGFVRCYEEPVLRDRYGAEYERYCAQVDAWLPRVHHR